MAWLQLAADEGHIEAKFQFGVMYRDGEGVPQEYARAFTCFKEAANQGHVESMIELSYIYRLGIGMPKNIKAADMWLQNSKDADNQHEI